MLRRFFLLLALCYSENALSQYFHYSQYNFTRQRVNPAMVGLTRYAAASLDYRHQKTGGNFAINSNFLSLEYPLLNSSTGQPWSGIGVTFHRDQSSGIFTTQEAALSYAIHIRMSKWQMLSVGAKALYQFRNISMDGLYTGSQYVPDRGFDPSFSSGENLADFRTQFATYSTGLYWQETDKRGRLLHHFGFSLFDFNKPNDSFFGNASQLASTFVFNGGFQAFTNSGLHVFPEALITVSSSNVVANTGLRFQKELNPKSKQLSDRVEVLTKYAIGRSGIIGFQFHRENFSVGVSYDFPLFRLNAGNVGALEIGLELRKLVPTRAQKISAKRKKIQEEKQKAAIAKKTPNTQTTANKAVVPDPIQGATPNHTTPPDTVSTPAPIEIFKTGDLDKKPEAGAQVGDLKQEPLIVEKVTLHFAFDFNSAELDETTESFLHDLTTTLKENENLRVTITGHTDNIGSDKFNLRLSQKRADAVLHHFRKSGIAPERMQSEGKGMHQPLNENKTDAERAKNRRVEITLYY